MQGPPVCEMAHPWGTSPRASVEGDGACRCLSVVCVSAFTRCQVRNVACAYPTSTDSNLDDVPRTLDSSAPSYVTQPPANLPVGAVPPEWSAIAGGVSI